MRLLELTLVDIGQHGHFNARLLHLFGEELGKLLPIHGVGEEESQCDLFLGGNGWEKVGDERKSIGEERKKGSGNKETMNNGESEGKNWA